MFSRHLRSVGVLAAFAALAPSLDSSAIAAVISAGRHRTASIPILLNDRHIYARPNKLRRNRLLAALVRRSSILLPLRSLIERLGGTITYDARSKAILVEKPGATIRLAIGTPQVDINGDVRPLDVPPEMVRGIVYVPIRVIAESMGAFVAYVPKYRIVAIRYVEPIQGAISTPQPARALPLVPAAPLVRATVGPGAPIPEPPPGPETFVAGDVAIVPSVSNAYAPRVTGLTFRSYEARAASELGTTGLMLDASYRAFAYVHPNGFVNEIGTYLPGYVSSFSARENAIDAHLGLKLSQSKWYVSAGYTTLGNNYGYPTLSGIGFGLQKLPILARPVSYELGAFYYPNVGGTSGPYDLAYKLLTYRAALTASIGPTFVEAGYRGDRGYGKAYVPGNGFSHAGPYAGIGLHF